MGFAYQNKGDNEKALECYKKFELACDTNVWNIKHIAQTYRALHNYDKAVEYFEKAEKAEPTNVGLALNFGHCLLEKGDANKALNKYFMVDFMEGPNTRLGGLLPGAHSWLETTTRAKATTPK